MASITIANLVKSFERQRALDRVSLRIESGELFFLLGPSGCGKTTLLRSLAGLTAPDAGQIFIDERDVTHASAQQRGAAMVFQSYALWPHMSVESNVAFGLEVLRVPRAERRRRVAEALEQVRMGPFARRRPNQLSGGQQQRVALARAMVVRPRCLLLDEPLSNLDARLRLEMRGEIRRLVKEFGLTAVYVTHDQKEALTIADRMVVMFDGRIEQLGSPPELYRAPQTRRVAEFLGETNFVPGVVQSADGLHVLVQTALGPLVALRRQSAPLGNGQRCTLSIRPEALDLAAGSGRNRLRGQIQESVYLGEAVQARVAIGTAALQVLVPQHAAAPRLEPGAPVEIGVDPADVVLFAE